MSKGEADVMRLEIRVNGVDHVVNVAGQPSLLDVLRNDLGLKGSKKACDGNECGSCTVLLEGKSAMSCAIPASRVGNKEVVTIEGLGDVQRTEHGDLTSKAGLHPLQRAFAELGAAQCGFCIPGMIMQAEPLLRRQHAPSRSDVTRRLSRNMCRCTGYQKIVDAVIAASTAAREEAAKDELDGAFATPASATPADAAVIGVAVAKPDSWDHVTGRSLYAADLPGAGAVHVKLVRSPHHHARIVAVDTSGAEAMEGVVLVLTGDDLPPEAAMLNGRPQPFLLAREKVRFAGEAIVAIAAESEDVAAAAASRVRIDYEVLEAVLDPASAISAEAPLLYPPLRNWEEVSTVRLGDVDDAFRQSTAVVEGVYRTAPREHAPMEPEAGLASMEDGVLVIRSPHHHPFAAQHWIAELVGLEKERVRIICPAMGGNFGHRGDFAHSGILALTTARTGRPARIVYTREESLLGSGKAMSYLISCRTGADKDGRLTVFSAEILADGGCWLRRPVPGQSSTRMSVAQFAPGPYRIDAAYVRVVEACTNRPRSIPMRGTNIPDLAFAWESQMDMLADKLGMDPLEFRIRNAIRAGDKMITGTVLDEAVTARATLEALRQPYAQAQRRARSEPASAPWRRGIGIAALWMVMGGGRFEEAGGGWHGLKLGPARAAVGLLDDGRIRVRTGIVEKGQGISIAVQQIAAAEFCVPIESIVMIYGDTALAPYPIATSGQRTMFHAGGAVQAASKRLRRAMLAAAAGRLAEGAGALSLEQGHVRSAKLGAEVSLAELAAIMRDNGEPTEYEGTFVFEPSDRGQGPVFGYSSQLVELDVHEETGDVHVRRVTYVADPGKVINRQTLEGQVEGGVVMGLSYALKEHFVPGKTRTLKEYGLPGPRDVPEWIDTLIVEDPVLGGPQGAKGMAEMTCSAGIASVLNAIASASGARCYDVPALPNLVRAAISSPGQKSPVPFPGLPCQDRPGMAS